MNNAEDCFLVCSVLFNFNATNVGHQLSSHHLTFISVIIVQYNIMLISYEQRIFEKVTSFLSTKAPSPH